MERPPLRTYRYKGELIRQCENLGGEHHLGAWIIQSYHYVTWEPKPDLECTHWGSLKAAKAEITRFDRFPARKR
jgi:hypothetical protein